LAEQILLPAINLRGILSGHVGEKAAAAIPTDARASLDFRLVPDLTPDRVRAIVEEHIRKQGYYITNTDPDISTRLAHSMIAKLVWGAGYPATRTPADAPLVRAFLRTLGEAGIAVAVTPAWGASLPTNVFADVLKAPIVFLSTVNYDNNQHAANENLRLQNLWDGIEIYATTLMQLGRAWR
jgi:acetylornithine deacetylase/succinyl-diaminopimelate desuccinylase-like protein